MNGWVNYDDVTEQLQRSGFDVSAPEVGRMKRVRVEGCSQKGWYSLHEIRLNDGRFAIVGAFGWWKGAEKFQFNIELRIGDEKPQLDADQRAAVKQRMAEAKKAADAARAAQAKKAAEQATRAWGKYSTTGDCDYLAEKHVQAHGVRFTSASSIVIPLADTGGRIHGLQLIYPKGHPKRAKTGRNKDFWPTGMAKAGHFHQIGAVRDLVLVAEGYATAATLFESCALPVAVAFDAGNLQPVALALQKRHPRAKILICADDDWKTDGNPGVAKAAAAALAVGGAWVQPIFSTPDRGDKHTDFNDLAALEGSGVVVQQVTQRLADLRWDRTAPAAREKPAGGAGDGGREDLAAIESVDELHDRFSLVYEMAETVFDGQEHKLVPLASMRNSCISRMLHRQWMDSREKKIVRVSQVGFDPAGRDPNIRCNLWGGWPTKPKAGSCERLLELLQFLCSHEDNSAHIYEWVLRWLAYPIQNPGAKMATALVLHGPQGTGKNLFFESIMAIYGEYGRIVDQAAVEDKFNDWASRRLFLIADEVVARMELYHTKNKLKSLITGEWIRINPKNIGAYDERNHVNLVFLSNETQPLVLERDDRRYTVIWTPEKLGASFYDEVAAEIRAGGIAALHDYLLNLPLGDFSPHTKPPMTQAKADLIAMGMDSTERFWVDWMDQQLPIPICPAKTEDLYDAYRWWCQRQGIGKPAQASTLIANSAKRRGASKARKRVFVDLVSTQQEQVTVMFPPGSDPASPIRDLTEAVIEFHAKLDEWKEGFGTPVKLRAVK